MIIRRLIYGSFALAFICQVAGATDLRHLLPRPKASFDRPTGFIVNSFSPIVVADNADVPTMRAAVYLQKRIFLQFGVNVSLLHASAYDGPRGIFIGVQNTWPALSSMMKPRIPDGEELTHPEGYVLDVDETAITLEGVDTLGLFHGIVTILQLTNLKAGTATTVGAHVYDYPDYPARWVFSQHNLLVNSNLTDLETIADTMAMYKLNAIQQNDFKYNILQTQGSSYFQHIDSLKRFCGDRNIQIVPGVVGLGWSDGILYNDPNLAEGLHAVSTYVIESDTGRLIPDPRVTIANGGFENVQFAKFTGWTFYDGSNDPSYIDHVTVHSGTTSARCSHFHANNAFGNARFNTKVNCDSNGYYVMSFWYKTDDNFSGGEVQLLAIGGTDTNALTFTSLPLQPGMDWTRAEVTFNTLGNTSVNLYCGVWGADTGTIWFDDFQIQPGGLCNVLRRAGTPVTVTNTRSFKVYSEGTDYNYISDPKLDASLGAYFPWHTPPTFRRNPSGTLHNGDTVKISYYHPFAAVSDNSGNGSVMACVSEDTLYSILRDQVSRVKNLGYGSTFFMGHDEIRNMNHDAACLTRGLSPATLLANNITRCHDLIRSISPNSDILIWSDMLDSLHNAKNNYYLVNGDLRGDWLAVPKDLTIVNWNSTYAKQSLQYFSGLGFQQITSPYYDAGNTSTIRAWRLAQDSIANVRGMMYTTWQGDYRYVMPFAYYAWGAGPFMLHAPLDSSTLSKVSIDVDAEVYSDPYDIGDGVDSVWLSIYDLTGKKLMSADLGPLGKQRWHVTTTNFYQSGFQYDVTALNHQKLVRITPRYRVRPQTYVPNAPVLTSVDTVHFDATEVGRSSSKTIDVINLPNDALTAVMDSGVVQPQGTPFSISGIVPSLFLAGATKQVTLSFAPSVEGDFSATLGMYYNHGRVRQVVLVGTAIPKGSVPDAPSAALDVSIVPNPFNSRSVLMLRNASPSVRITLTDVLGHVIRLPYADEIVLDAKQLGLTEGTYVVRVEDGAKTITRNVVYLK